MENSLTNIDYVKSLQSNLRATFESAPGKEVMLFLETIGHWYPTILDSNETNDVVGRDANRRLLGTIKTLLKLTPEQIVAMAK